MQLSKIELPRLCFWNKDAEKLKLINPDDFREQELLVALGLQGSPLRKSFGITDRSEILKRQSIMRFFMENRSITNKIAALPIQDVSFPKNSLDFLRYYGKDGSQNPFVTLIDKACGALKSASAVVPGEVNKFSNFMCSVSERIHSIEREMVARIGNEVKKASYIEGYVNLRLNWRESFDAEILDSKMFGHKNYSYGLANYEPIRVPAWCDNIVFEKTGIESAIYSVVGKLNARRKRFYYSRLVLSGEAPDEITQAIKRFLRTSLTEFNASGGGISLPAEMKPRTKLSIAFRYNQDGLRIQLVDMQTDFSDEAALKRVNTKNFVSSDFPGYSRWELMRIRRENEEFNASAAEARKGLFTARMLEILGNATGLIDCISIPAEEADLSFKWFSVEALYKHESVAELFAVASLYREFFKEHFKILQEIAAVALILKKREEFFMERMSIPEILTDKHHLISFKSLSPIHLLAHEVEALNIVPLACIPDINGQLVAFTGQNAGGKSTAKEAIINAIYMAQSGLPVFGQAVRLNVKNRIGMVFMERGSGSTCELLLRKAKNILESLQDADPSKTLFILDEVGTGTQEVDGFDFGKRLLTRLTGSKCSVIFSTQITELAKFAEEKLQAACYSFDIKHGIRPGIGRGGINTLMKEIGMEELLT